VRGAATEAALAAAPWRGAAGAGTWLERGAGTDLPAGARWIQYRLALGATNSLRTPRIEAVRVQVD
ncbi:MAG: hypothetical protein ABIL09_29025, partial [Gemmatimonadota bacterium]